MTLTQIVTRFQPLLIPRYNWDFGFRSFATSTSVSLGVRKDTGNGLTKYFPDNPILTTSGRASLVAILRAMGLPDNARVAVPLYCCPVVFEAIEYAGCKCVFIDIQEADYGMSAEDLRKKITGVSAVVVVHMFGHPVDMKRIRSVAGSVPVIEDCAHSLFSLLEEIPTGWFGDAAFFSFRNGKYLSSGEASLIQTRDPSLRERIRDVVSTFSTWTPFEEAVHAAGSLVKSMAYKRPLYGLAGYHLGRVLDSKLNLSDKTGIALRQISSGYLELVKSRMEGFHDCIEHQRDVSINLLRRIKAGRLVLPREAPNVRSNFYQFPIRFPTHYDRDDMACYLFSRGIDTAKYLDDIAETAGDLYGYKGDCPLAEQCARTILIIPNHYTLETADVEHIVRRINEWSRWFSGT